MNARIPPASTRTAANVTTVTAPVGASSRKEPNIPAALAAAPAIQPITSATPMWEENKLPTSAGTMRKQKTSKTPAVANDFPGFVSNRILMPFINEAVHALAEGIADAEGIDTVARLGFGHPLGPLALADLIGLDTCVAIMEVLQEGLGDPKYAPCPLLREHVRAGRLGRKSGRGFYAYG